MQHSAIIDITVLLAIAKRKGLTQQELCDRAGLNRCIIHRIKKGKSEPKLSTIQKLIEAVNG